MTSAADGAKKELPKSDPFQYSKALKEGAKVGSLDGYRGEVVGVANSTPGFIFTGGNVNLSNTGVGSTSTADGLATATAIIGLGTAGVGLVSSIFDMCSGSQKITTTATTTENQLTDKQKRAIAESGVKTDKIIDNLSSSIDRVDECLNDPNFNKERAMSLSTTLGNYIASAEARMNSLQQKQNSLKVTRDNKQTAYDKKDQEYSDLSSQNETLITKTEELDDNLNELKNTDTSKMNETEKQAHNKKIRDLERTIDKNKKQIKKNEKELEKLEEAKTKLQEEIDNLTTQINNYQTNIDKVQENLPTARSKKRDLDNKINTTN